MTAEHISSALTSIGSAFANHIWQSTIFAAIAGLLTVLLRRHQARIRFALWLAASIKFLVPFSLLIALGGLIPKPQQIVPGSRTGLYAAIDVAGQPFSVDSAQPVRSGVHAESLVQHLTAQLPLVVAGIWFFGAFVVLLIWLARWRQVSAILRKASPIQQGREIRLLRRLEKTTGRRGQMALRLSPERMEPGVFGIVRPVLIWPERLSERLDEEQMEAILAHEMTHQRRHDNLAAAIHMLVEALFWFHPMVWWMERRMVEERERACDEAVVRLGSSPEAYAEGLLKACRFCVEAPLACVSGITGADLSRRVRSIMTLRLGLKLGLKGKLLLLLAASLTTIGPVMLGLWHRPTVLAQTVEPTGQAGVAAEKEQRMATDTKALSFDVASVRVNKLGGQSQSNFPLNSGPQYNVRGGLLIATHVPLMQLLVFAYAKNMYQIQAMRRQLPEWARETSFDVRARAKGNPTKEEMRAMMRSLLEERFALKMHTESREVPVFALVQAKPGKLGPRLRPHANGAACAKEAPYGTKDAVATVAGGFPAYCGAVVTMPGAGPEGETRVGGREVTMAEIALAVGGFGFDDVDRRMVVDGTGIPGTFDALLDFQPESPDPARAEDEPPIGASLAEALREQWGLKMVSRKGTAEVFVIDHVEMPSAN